MSKRLLITGGSGFLGRHLGRRLRDEYEIVLGSRNHKLNLAAERFSGCPSVPLDVSSLESVRDAFAQVQPNVVIHAAATKFVDLSERAPMECLDVNVTGSKNVARAAVDSKVESVIGISTDKAAPPVTNTYALSKALMERVFCAMNGKTQTKFACTRCGNIAWSTGSVLTQWEEMQRGGGVIRTTGPEMFRFFVTIEEAVDLTCVALNELDQLQGKVLTRAMKSVQIKDLLELWTELRGGTWETADRRVGDSVHEDLIGDAEAEFTRQGEFGGSAHFVVSFNERPAHALQTGISSATAPRLDREELTCLLEAAGE